MTLKPPTRTFPKLVMKEWPKTQPELDDALARLLSPDFTRVLEGVEGQKRPQKEKSRDE